MFTINHSIDYIDIPLIVNRAVDFLMCQKIIPKPAVARRTYE